MFKNNCTGSPKRLGDLYAYKISTISKCSLTVFCSDKTEEQSIISGSSA